MANIDSNEQDRATIDFNGYIITLAGYYLGKMKMAD